MATGTGAARGWGWGYSGWGTWHGHWQWSGEWWSDGWWSDDWLDRLGDRTGEWRHVTHDLRRWLDQMPRIWWRDPSSQVAGSSDQVAGSYASSTFHSESWSGSRTTTPTASSQRTVSSPREVEDTERYFMWLDRRRRLNNLRAFWSWSQNLRGRGTTLRSQVAGSSAQVAGSVGSIDSWSGSRPTQRPHPQVVATWMRLARAALCLQGRRQILEAEETC